MAKYQLFNEWLKNNIQEIQGMMSIAELVAGYSDNLEHNELLTIMPELVKRALKEVYPQDPEYQTIFRMIVEANPPRFPAWWPAFKDNPEKWIREKASDWQKVQGPTGQEPSMWQRTAEKLQR